MGFGAALSLVDLELRCVKLLHQVMGGPEKQYLDSACECGGLSLQVWCLADNIVTVTKSAARSNDQRIAALCIMAAVFGGVASATQVHMIQAKVPDPDELILSVAGNFGDCVLSSTACGLLCKLIFYVDMRETNCCDL
jgi:hypothetical protein